MDRPFEKSSSQDTLVLVPTELERRRLATPLAPSMQLAGFGPVAAAARTSQLLRNGTFAKVILIGIAGTYDPARLAVGEAAAFDSLCMWGLGAGSGVEYQGLSTMGFDQWPGDEATEPVRDRLLANSGSGTLVTVCAASGGPRDVARVLAAYPDALAEDMEAFGVALACHLARVPFHCLRGASNLAGDRETSRWHIAEALQAVSTLAATHFPTLWKRV